VTLAVADAAEAVAWAARQAERFSLNPAGLEDVYVGLTSQGDRDAALVS